MSWCKKKSLFSMKFLFFILILLFLINFSLAANLNVTLSVPNSQVVHSQNILVYGIVTNSTGSPISNANVTLFAPNCDWNYSLTGNYYGNLSFPGFNIIINNISVAQFNGSAGSGSIRISGCNIAVPGSIDAYGKGFGGGGGGGAIFFNAGGSGNSEVDGSMGNFMGSAYGGAGGGFGGGAGGGGVSDSQRGAGTLGGGNGAPGSPTGQWSGSGGGGAGSGNGICVAANGTAYPNAGAAGCAGGGNGGAGSDQGFCSESGGGGGGGAGPFGGNGGSAGGRPGANGNPGGYNAAGSNNDASTDFSLLIGSGGGGGAGSRVVCNSGADGGHGGLEGGNVTYRSVAGAGGGGAAGGGMIILNAYNNILVNGILNASGAGKSSLAGGYGAGGGILLIAKTINVSSGNIRTLGGDKAGGGVRTNGGTIKVFYNTSFFGSIPVANSARNYNSSTSGVNISLQNFGIITTNSTGGFSFNITAPNLKSFYNVSANVSSSSDSGISSLNIQVIGLPEVYFDSPTISSGTTFTGTSFIVNVSARNNSYSNLTVNVYNSYGALVRSNFSSANQTFMNFTGLGGGVYYFNATAYNLAGYSNTTETRTITISTDLRLNFFGQIGTGGNISTSGNYTIHRFSYNGSDQIFVAGTPADVEIKMWGAGGGGGNAGGWSYGFAGGGGGYTTYNYSMIVGQTFIVMVGQGGAGGSIVSLYPTYGGGSRSCNVNSDCRYGGQGGGRSAIRNLTDDILTAGGGGGGGSSRASNGQRGGAGGGAIAQDGVSYNTAYRGRGGNQTAGGIIPSGGAGLTAGSKYTGGNPSNNGYGGGGGGGYYGGSGGGYAESNDMGGGGGGSGFVFGNGITLTGNYETPANSADPDRGNAGTGGAVNSRGSNGTVIFKYLTPISRALPNNSLGRQHSIFTDVYLASSNLKNVTYYLYNSSTLVNVSTYTSVSANSINWTNLSDGIYYFNVTAYDNSNSYAQTDTRVITLDSTFPNATLISPGNATISSNSSINFTANITDNLGIKNITLKILNLRNNTLISSVYGGGNLSAGTVLVNAGLVVSLNDGLYSWYYDIFDYAENNYISESRNLTVDNPPNATLSSPANNSYVNGSPTFTADLVDLGTGISNATFYIYNSTDLVYNYTNSSFVTETLTATITIPVVLIQDVYTWFVKVFDWSANLFYTENRTLTVDTTLPIVNLSSPDKYYNTSIDSWNLTAILSDNFGVKNATLRVYDNSGALYDSQVFKNGSGSSSLKSCSDILTSDPTSVDGLYSVCPDDINCYQVYCDMTHGGWSSIFKLDSYLTLDSNDCVINYDNDDMDSTIMWQDLSTKISYYNNDDTDQAYWFSWQRDGTQDMNPNYLPNRPGNIGSNARPVPLPLANTTIWFDWQNSQIAWIINGDTYTKTFSDAGISGSGYMDYPGYNYYFISDGVSMIHVGQYNWGAVVLKFDFVANNFSTESASVLSPPYSWFDTEEDTFGNVLYTVNGRVMYYVGNGYFRLGGTLSDPNSLADDYSVLYPLGYDTQHAIDFFARVDNSGYLWFGDWGHDDGGYFNCGNDNYYGVARSNILLTYQDIPPTAPVSAGGAFEEGLLNTNVSKQFTFDDGIYNWSYQTTDLAGNMVISENRTLTVDTTPPAISNVVYSPNLQPSVDPGQTLIFNATVSDALIGVNSVILQVNNSTAQSNYSMIHTTGNLYVGSINLSMVNNLTYTYNVWANDSLNNAYQSQNRNFISLWDCTWNFTTYKSPYTSFGSIAGYDINKNIGNITIFNTGDAAYYNYNCSLVFRLSNNLGANRIYFDGASLNPSDSYILDAKNNATILVDASFSASTSVVTESLNIVIDDVYDRSETSSKNVTATLVTSQAGPYLIQDDISYDPIVELLPGNFSLDAYLQNVMGDNLIPNRNNTAYNVSFEWIVPSEFKNISGNSSIYFENISDINLHYNPITLGFNDLETMSDGVKTFYLVSRGYKNLTGNLSLITNELGKNVLNDSFNITFTCKNVSGDGICVSGCRYSHIEDSDCAAVGTGGNDGKGGNTGNGGSGGGGGSSASGSKVEKSEANFELVRGDQNEFQFEVKNRYDYDLTGVNITVSGINAEYIKISPSSFASLKAKEARNITVKISAPAYFSGKKYTLIFDITGKMVDNSTGKKIDYTDRKAVTLSIVEIPRVQAEDLLINATNYLEEMNKSGMVLKEASALFSSLNGSYNEVEFGKVKQAYAQLKLLHDNAFEAKALIEELIASLADAKINGIKTTEAKKLLLLGQTIYERGDYALALERLKEAKLTYALEVKGEFNLAYAIKNHPLESLGILIGLGLVSLGSGLAIRFQLLRRKLRMLNEEEVLLLELMKVIQKECFEKNHMSMEEYESAMFQYENRLSETVQEKITTETKIANLLKIKGKRIALGEEKNRLIGMIRKVQDDYLNKGTIETRIYENMIRSYTARLSEVQEKIATIDADEAVRRVKKISD